MSQTESNKILSDIIVHSKYARYLPDKQRRETWDEVVERNIVMHEGKYPILAHNIRSVFNTYVKTKKVLPSMRAAQFAGLPVIRNPSRIYNCGYMPASDSKFFSELMFLLLGGTGVGYSVQLRHTISMPKVLGPDTTGRARRYVIGDSIEGWSDAVKLLVESFFYGKKRIRFDFDDIRSKGVLLVTSGGKAPGPDPLRECLIKLGAVLHAAIGRNLTPLEIHDMACHIADAVLAGGIRRAAMIVLFDLDDMEMMTCKSGDWWEANPQRGRANNSAIILRGSIDKVTFDLLWERIRLSGSGEPGIYWTNDLDWGTNPCCEIALRAFQFCNLTTVNISDAEPFGDFQERCSAAAFIGTLQAGYTDFHYLRQEWQEVTEKEALIGVSLTGIASGNYTKLDIAEGAEIVRRTNVLVSSQIGIRPAARTTTVKPEGTASIVLGCSSGIHAWHAPYYLRRIRLGKNEALCKYLTKNLPSVVEDEYFNPTTQSVISIPQAAPEGSIYRDEAAISLISRTLAFNHFWVGAGHVSGTNHNNVSCTVSIKEDEWEEVGAALWYNRSSYNGMAILPYDGGTYKQAPFEDISEKEFLELEKTLRSIDLTNVIEEEDNTDLVSEAACGGGICEIV